jgi:hypothetical protein
MIKCVACRAERKPELARTTIFCLGLSSIIERARGS